MTGALPEPIPKKWNAAVKLHYFTNTKCGAVFGQTPISKNLSGVGRFKLSRSHHLHGYSSKTERDINKSLLCS